MITIIILFQTWCINGKVTGVLLKRVRIIQKIAGPFYPQNKQANDTFAL